MRVYHFLNSKWALSDLRHRRLRISRFADLNDPFEFMSFSLTDADRRRRVYDLVANMNDDYGLVCFSQAWSNPVLWSHYADRHRGICLGFDIPDEALAKVQYIGKRQSGVGLKQIDIGTPAEAQAVVRQMLSTKFLHWRYEAEHRCFVDLNGAKRKGSNFFQPFSSDLVLKEVIVGAQSNVSRATVAEILKRQNGVHAFKARLAFASFKVVKNRRAELWV